MSKEKPTTTEQRTPWAAYVEAELGFRNHWYPAFFGSELAEADVSAGLGEAVAQVKSVVVLGERILFRRVEGQVYAIHDQCIHKGVAFSKNPECYTKTSVTCWYHGFTYELPSGNLINIVTDPESALIGRHRIKTVSRQSI